jgi:hypothetical protein
LADSIDEILVDLSTFKEKRMILVRGEESG